MAYDRKFLNAGGTPAGPGPTLWTYSTADSLTTVATDGYFDADWAHFETGDILFVYSYAQSDNGTGMFSVTKTKGDIALTALTFAS